MSEPVRTRKIAIIGAGITGLTLAYELACQGFQVEVFEAGTAIGGELGVVDVNGESLERFYHHLFLDSPELIGLMGRLRIADRLSWKSPAMGYFARGQLRPFSTPWDLLKFTPISLGARIRLGLAALRLQRISDYHPFEDQRAAEVLPRLSGEEAFSLIWRPLLEAKFGEHWESVSMAWFWNRVHVRSRSRRRFALRESLGYVDGSFLVITRALAQAATGMGAQIHLRSPVSKISHRNGRVRSIWSNGREIAFGAVIGTIGLPILARLLPDHEKTIVIPRIVYRGALVLLLQLRNRLSRYYWTNVSDPAIPFPLLVEHTNFIDPERYGGANLLYIGNYLDPSHPYFDLSADQLLAEYQPAVRRVYPNFAPNQVENLWLSADKVAQPVIAAGYQHQVPGFATALDGFFICNTSQIYPEDRGTNYNVRIAQKCAELVCSGRLAEQ